MAHTIKFNKKLAERLNKEQEFIVKHYPSLIADIPKDISKKNLGRTIKNPYYTQVKKQ